MQTRFAKFFRWLTNEWRAHRFAMLFAVLLTLVTVGTRVDALDRRSLWVDELRAARCITPDLNSFFDCLRGLEDQAPLPNLLNYVWYRLAGSAILPQPDWFVRVPSLLLGIASVPFAWKLADELLGRRAAWVMAWLWALSPLAIGSSQQVRPYSAYVFFSLLSSLLLVLALRSSRRRYWIGFGIIAALNLDAHFLALTVLAGQGVLALLWQIRATVRAARAVDGQRANSFTMWKKLYGSTAWGILAFGITLIPTLPDLIRFLVTNPTNPAFYYVSPYLSYGGQLAYWLLSGEISFWDIRYLNVPIEWSIGLGVLSILGLLWLMRHARFTLLFIACNLLIPLVVFFFARGGFPVGARYMFAGMIGFYLLLAASVEMLIEVGKFVLRSVTLPAFARRTLPWVAVALLLATLLPELESYYTLPFDDWRGLAEYLRQNAGPNDVVLSLGNYTYYSNLALNYYLPNPYTNLLSLDVNSLDLNLTRRLQAREGRVWGVVVNYEAIPEETLTRAGYTPIGFSNLWLLAPDPNGEIKSTTAGASSILTNFADLNPQLPGQPAALMSPLTDNPLNLLRNAGWQDEPGKPFLWWEQYGMPPRIAFENGVSGLALTRAESDPDTFVVQRVDLQPGATYLLRFECRNELQSGTQHISVTFQRTDGSWSEAPFGGSYFCPNTRTWEIAAVTFQAPPPDVAPARVVLFLTNDGVGTAYFRYITLIEVPSAK